MKSSVNRFKGVLLVAALAIGNVVHAADKTVEDYSSSLGKEAGDHLRLSTDVYGFEPLSDAEGVAATKRCAGRDTVFSIVDKTATHTVVKFYTVEEPESADTCPKVVTKVNDKKTVAHELMPAVGSLYKIENTTFDVLQTKTTGLSYGALVVPFKFRLGSDKKLVNSATVAPYIGLRWSKLQGFGYEIKPVLAAGIATVSVNDPATNQDENKAAFSLSVGLTLTTVKDSKFSAGILFGKDFLSKNERKNDPSVIKPWASIWLGVAL